jgi:secreted trypsin-like serine protease
MRRSILGLTAGLVVAAVAAGPALRADAVANGEPVPLGKYAFSVKLTMTGIPTADGGRRNSACSGALVAPHWIVTAGHCFRDVDGVRVEHPVADLTTATIGRTDLTDPSRGHETEVIAVRQSPTADVALAEIADPVRDVRPIGLSHTAPSPGDILRVTGYGSTTSVNPAPVTWLRTGELEVVSLTDAVVGLHGYAPAPDTTPCPYDSGGPYFVERPRRWPALVAVVSNGPSCPHTETENGARTDNITAWIDEAIRR